MRQNTGAGRDRRVSIAGLVAGLCLALILIGFNGPPTASASPIELPPVGVGVDYQLGGAYDPPAGTEIVVRDSTDRPASGLYSVCYVNAFQTQPGQRGVSHLLLRDRRGKAIADPDWPSEYLFDLRTKTKRIAVLRSVVRPALDRCAKAGFEAAEPDNLDSWTRSHRRMDRTDAILMARAISSSAHHRALAVAQKNAAELLGSRLGTDFAVVEECQVYDECGDFFDEYGRRMIEIEYDHTAFEQSCDANRGRWSIVFRDRDLSTPGDPGYRFESCPAG